MHHPADVEVFLVNIYRNVKQCREKILLFETFQSLRSGVARLDTLLIPLLFLIFDFGFVVAGVFGEVLAFWLGTVLNGSSRGNITGA